MMDRANGMMDRSDVGYLLMDKILIIDNFLITGRISMDSTILDMDRVSGDALIFIGLESKRWLCRFTRRCWRINDGIDVEGLTMRW